jgi:hypothetical protein
MIGFQVKFEEFAGMSYPKSQTLKAYEESVRKCYSRIKYRPWTSGCQPLSFRGTRGVLVFFSCLSK